MKVLNIVSRIIIGLVFIFSGTVKAIDPLGSGYKFHDYFQAFHMNYLQFLALPLGILLCTAEFIAGFSVLTGYRQKTGIWGVLVLMLIFTPLTFILALSNPVSDCGCFGDAIHLTNWQTFGKNIVLLVFTIILFAGRNQIKPLFNSGTEWTIVSLMIVLFVIFSVLNLRYLPVIDFLPYKTGVNIPENLVVPENKVVDKFKTSFIYEKDGVRKEFTLDNYPAGDSTWKFVDQKSVLIRKGFQPPIHDFSITSSENEDITEKVLNYKDYSLLMVSKKLKDAESRELQKGFELGLQCLANGINFYILTASGSDDLKKFDNGLLFCSGDETTLKTIVRANPGYLLLKEGTIIGKWSWANVPEKEWFNGDLSGKQIEKLNNREDILIVITIVLSVTVLILLISKFYKRKTSEFLS
jgi:hypothetical protein